MIFEFCDKDLRAHLSDSSYIFNEEIFKNYMHQLISGISYCHVMGCLHRDIKPQNILVKNSQILKIADFGLARLFNFMSDSRDITKEMITLWYRPPEVLLGSSTYSFSSDIWSIGLVLIEMITKIPLFMGSSQVEMIFIIFKFFGF